MQGLERDSAFSDCWTCSVFNVFVLVLSLPSFDRRARIRSVDGEQRKSGPANRIVCLAEAIQLSRRPKRPMPRRTIPVIVL